jgi:cephalosporin hydroxylase
MDPKQEFNIEKSNRIKSYEHNADLKEAARVFNIVSNRNKYSYNFSWMGRPIIQYPQDMLAMQEIIYALKPDIIIETGIAHGGSLIYYASLLELIGKGKVIGIDIDIREHNRIEIENHPMYKRIQMIQGSSIDPKIIEHLHSEIKKDDIVMVLLDSNHTHEHVLEELKLYHPLVSKDSYLVVFDTIIEDMPKGMYDRPWDVGNNAKTAVIEFLKENTDFEIDHEIDNKLLVSVAPQGYLRRIN